MDPWCDSGWRYVAAVLAPADLPMLAAHALVAGHDSPALRELAGLPRRSDESEIRALYVAAMDELGLPLPDGVTAGRRLLVSLAWALVRGERSAVDVGGGLGWTVEADTEEESRFLSTAAEYSQWMGPERLPSWARELEAAARALCAVSEYGGGHTGCGAATRAGT
ncbi:hypothetical protein [Streptomyces zhihengii]|uniref:hypothetical protein n=1 Tax=Streptomyces zhihengii TaxID=1818004 RepID=UPI0033BF361D